MRNRFYVWGFINVDAITLHKNLNCVERALREDRSDVAKTNIRFAKSYLLLIA